MKTQESIRDKIINRVRAIKDQRFLNEILDYVSSVEQVRKAKQEQLEHDIIEAVDNLNNVRRGELKARPARELLDEL